VAIETPSLEWIVDNGCFLDLFYEHCNYFSMASLAYLCRSAGFRILRHRRVFRDQYQVIELKHGSRGRPAASPGIPANATLGRFQEIMLNARQALEARLKAVGATRGWAVWGAGGKGVALVNQLRFRRPSFVVDANPAKHGCVIPGTSVPIISPEDGRV